jgi:AbrB family looped-hinge helix DNA binding protein
METVSVSPKFQVVIPKSIREAMNLNVGQKLHVMQYGDRVELMPVLSLTQARGFLAGIDTSVEREGDRA